MTGGAGAPLRLWRAAGFVLVLLPLAMAAANRSSPLVVGIAAVLTLAAAVVERGSRATMLDLAAPLRTPLGLAALAFLAWCLVSLAWSPVPAISGRTLSEFAPALACAYVLARLLPERLADEAPRIVRLAALGLALACAYVVADLAADLWVQRRLGLRVALFVFNRPVITAALLLFPLAMGLALAPHPARARGRLAALLLIAAVAGAIWRSVSGAATMGLAAGVLAAGLGALLPARLAGGACALALGLAVALAPVEGDLLARLMPDALHERLAASSSRVRVSVARSFGAAVAADPWRGAGYGTSAAFAQVPAAAGLPEEARIFLTVGHPHNVALQVWAELGIVGAILGAAVLFLVLGRIGALPHGARIAALGLLAAAAAVAYVEHGAWQAWWTAVVGAAATWTRALAMRIGERSRA